ncbi:MAG TPA: 2-oxo acid dehydrogenase subunit E2 [Planctomycetota bacterium]|nr:2-oxo acid dehydrogenase subunit E2 [Planctomycetota bacterium]
MALEFKLPDIGEGVAEGEIVKWLVSEGDTVAEHQAVVEVMTDKATVEIPAPRAGTIQELRAQPGDVVAVGSVLFVLGDGAGGAAKKSEQPQEADKAEQTEAPEMTEATKESKETESAPAAKSAAAKAGGATATAAPPKAPAKSSAPASGGRVLEFKLPDIGEGVAEGEIVQWLVSEGDEVAEHQAVVEVMTDKATVEIPSPAAGTIGELRAKAGDVVPVHTVIFTLRTAGAAPAKESAPAPKTQSEDQPARESSAAAPARKASNGKVLAVPSARRVARELGIDLSDVTGSGRNGVVRRADVEAFAERGDQTAPEAKPASAKPAAAQRPAAAPISFEPGERETRTPFRGVRRKIAEAMVRSAFTAVHFTVVEEVDVTDLVTLRGQAKALGAEQGIKVTFMPFLMKATALALARHPMLNGHLDEAAGELVHCHYVNIGVAMDTAQGLIVPVIDEVQSKGVLQLAAELEELAERTRAGKVKPDDLRGSTFSITNAGNIGGTLATPIINFPDIAILGVHRIVKRPGVIETPEGDEIAVRQYMNLSCSVDHRLADGADAARFLAYLRRLLENPGLLAL